MYMRLFRLIISLEKKMCCLDHNGYSPILIPSKDDWDMFVNAM